MSALRRILAATVPLVLAMGLAACGGDSDASNAGSGGGEAEPGAFPVTIEHKYGSTTLTKAPTRVVSVGLTDQDALLAVGIVPVAVTKWFGDAPGYIFPWAEEALGDGKLPTVLEDTNGVQIEKVIALKPDLIIGTYSGLTEKDYQSLSKIAPTVAQNGDYADYGTPWDEAALTIGDAVGQPRAMKAVVDGVKDQISTAAAEHPEFTGKSAIIVTPYEGLFVYGPEDPRTRMLTELGFDFPSEVFDGGGDEYGASLSAERTADLGQVDLVVWYDLASTGKGVKSLFDNTPTATDGRWFDIDEKTGGDYYVAHNFVTPLSIPYVLERYVPQLEAAIDGDPDTEVPTVTN